MSSKTGLILEGGAIRGIFTAGVLDSLMEHNIDFPYVSGVSVGVSNASGFVSHQIGRSKKVLTHEGTRSFYGLPNILRTGKVVDLQECITNYAMKNFPYDFEAYHKCESLWEVVVVNCETGEPEYVSEFSDDMECLDFCQASCSLPFICPPKKLRGKTYMDGSLADSLPIQRALDCGCDKVVIILTKAETHDATDYRKYKLFVDMFYKKKYPKLAETILNRKAEYERQMELIERLQREGRAIIIKPEKTMVGHFETNKKKLENCYQYAHALMEGKIDELRAFMAE